MANKFTKDDFFNARKYAKDHRGQLLKDKKCGCFSCGIIFHPYEIEEWIEDDKGTAICPNCLIDAVIGESSGFPITKEFLKEMNDFWYRSIEGFPWIGFWDED